MNRTPKYLSFSALSLFEKSPDDYFMRYICPVKTERQPQTDPMSVGSAFDALIKNRLSIDLFGQEHTDATNFGIRDLIAKQCEPHTLPESLQLACEAFENYVSCGAYDALLDDVQLSALEPRMEFRVTREIEGVPLLGYPDLHYQTRGGNHVIADFKVSGACSKAGVSPQQGFKIARDTRGSSTHGQPHRKYLPFEYEPGLEVNSIGMNETTDYWAAQMTGYAWCLGEPVASQRFICRIEQLACRPNKDGFMRVKACTHTGVVGTNFQYELIARYQRCWQAIQDDHIWLDLTVEQSRARGDLLTRSVKMKDVVAGYDLGGVTDITWSIQ